MVWISNSLRLENQGEPLKQVQQRPAALLHRWDLERYPLKIVFLEILNTIGMA